jgi:hypothetical protein
MLWYACPDFSAIQFLNEKFNVWSLSTSARVIISRPSLQFLGAIRALTNGDVVVQLLGDESVVSGFV